MVMPRPPARTMTAESVDRPRHRRFAINPARRGGQKPPPEIVNRERMAMAMFNRKSRLLCPSRLRWLFGKLVPRSATYRPERYYMRGPGPKYRERNGAH